MGAERDDSAQVVTILITEHFTPQTARGATISDTNGRTALYLHSVYLEAAPHLAPYFLVSAHDGPGTGQNMGGVASPAQFLVTSAGTVAIINSIVGGVVTGLAAQRFFAPPLAMSAGTGVVAALVSVALHFRFEGAQWRAFERRTPALFPTPAGDATQM